MEIVTEDGAELYPVCHFNVAINSLVDGDEEGFEALKCIGLRTKSGHSYLIIFGPYFNPCLRFFSGRVC